jgi:cytochrome c peroxidase
MRVRVFLASALLAGTALVQGVSAAEPARTRADWKHDYVRPASIPFPDDNPYSIDKAELGKVLFFEPRLSGSNWIACATCHNPALGWGDGLAKGIGQGMNSLKRRTPTIQNLAWARLLMWDGRQASLEAQALGPIQAGVEMSQDLASLLEELKAVPGYATLFNTAFPGEGITGETIGKAIATFERMVVSGAAPFDRWIAGDETAIPESAKRGFDIFNDKGNCASCHTGWSFTNHGFADIGLPDGDAGRGAIVKFDKMQHAFKTPGLRDIERRGPYMHDGSIATLEAVVEHYDTGFVERPSLSMNVRRLNLTGQERADLVAFMRTLTSDQQVLILPVLPMARR